MQDHIPLAQVRRLLPPHIWRTLGQLVTERGLTLYLAGGTVRDLLLGRVCVDVDMTVAREAALLARELAPRLGGAYVPLGRDEDAARVVAGGLVLDFSSFRAGARTIDEELGLRDITINSMAVSLTQVLADSPDEPALPVIDPLGGLADLAAGLIRHDAAQSFHDDPLRVLRVHRFAAVLGFAVDPATLALAAAHGGEFVRVAVERVAHEMELILVSGRAADELGRMAGSGVLWRVLPELRAGEGLAQPASHHLDVFGHSLAALAETEELLARPRAHFGPLAEEVIGYLERVPRCRLRLLWAALLHDLGKPATHALDASRKQRITFHNHDRVGARLCRELARRLRWSREDGETVAALVAGHMRPFHLNNVRRQAPLSLRACLRYLREVGEELPGAMLLALADARAGRGEGRPRRVEEEVCELFAELLRVRRQHVLPVRGGPPLITGHDLIRRFGLSPGPAFAPLLRRVEEACMEGLVRDREGALALVTRLLARQACRGAD